MTAFTERLSDEIRNFQSSTKVMEVLHVANIKLKNEFEAKLGEYEKIFADQGIYILRDLQNITSRTWRIIKIDEIFTNMIKKILNIYNSNYDTQNAKHENENNKPDAKKDWYTLLKCNNTVSCIIGDDKFIHIATMDGTIKAFEFEIFDAFHEFKLLDSDNEIHVASYMQFLGNSHEQLVTADKNGNVCCWYLHSQHPNKRAKCIRKFKTHDGHISGFGIPKQSELIFTIGFDGYLRVRNLGFNGNIIHSFKYGNVALTTMIFMSKTCVLIGTENGIIMQIDIRKEKILNSFQMVESVPIRSLCLDDENNHLYFSFGEYSIGLLDVENDGEWSFVGKMVEGFEHHESAVNGLALRNEYLWSCSEDNSVRIWDLKFLRENLEMAASKKKGKNAVTMPNCMKLGDAEKLNDNTKMAMDGAKIDDDNLLEVWCSIDINGMYHNGVQEIHFMENESMMIATSYQKEVIAYNLQKIDNILPQKQALISERREQLNNFEKELQSMQEKEKEADKAKAEKKGKKGGKGKGKKKK